MMNRPVTSDEQPGVSTFRVKADLADRIALVLVDGHLELVDVDRPGSRAGARSRAWAASRNAQPEARVSARAAQTTVDG